MFQILLIGGNVNVHALVRRLGTLAIMPFVASWRQAEILE